MCRPGYGDLGAHVNYKDPRLLQPRQDIDRRPAGSEVPNHLRGHFLGVGADSFLGHSVIGRHEHHGPIEHRRIRFTGDGRQLAGQFFKATEAPAWLRLVIEPSLSLSGRQLADRRNASTGAFQQCHRTVPPSLTVATIGPGFKRNIMPRTPKYTSSANTANLW
jgi:hypothetical protein